MGWRSRCNSKHGDPEEIIAARKMTGSGNSECLFATLRIPFVVFYRFRPKNLLASREIAAGHETRVLEILERVLTRGRA